MIARVFVPDAAGEGHLVVVPSDEAQHLVRVLRLSPGSAVRVFDGRGHEWQAVLHEATRRVVVAQIGAPFTPAPETRIAYTLAIAALKGDGTDHVVRDAVMLGVTAIRPFVSTRAETTLAALARGHRRERWQRIAVASAKQCGRAVVPAVHEAVDLAALLATDDGGVRLLLVEPGVETAVTTPEAVPPPDAACLAVGPEGGWTTEEVAAAVAAGWRALRIGRRVLRAETAPLVALAACQTRWADL